MQVFTNPLVSMILATLLSLMTPGNTVFSQTNIPICDEQCQQTKLCDNENYWQCKKPVFSKELYLEYTKQFDDNEARIRSFTRPETYDEGLVRYLIIAEAIDNVSKKVTLNSCRNDCGDSVECKHDCNTSAIWSWKQKDLALMMSVSANQESGFRSDVQGGTGDYGRGDCQWKYADGSYAPPFAKKAVPVKDTCMSVCLGQIRIGKSSTINDWKADDLIGIDLTSTEKCMTVVATYLAKSRTLCTKWNKTEGDWVKATFSAYGSGTSCVLYQSKIEIVNGNKVKDFAYLVQNGDKKEVAWSPFPPDNAVSKIPLEKLWPIGRTRLFHVYKKRELILSDKVIASLNKPEVVAAHDRLTTSKQKILWMTPLN